MCKSGGGFSGSTILRNQPLFPIPIVLDLTGCRKCQNFGGKHLKISQKLHGGDRKHMVCKKIPKILKFWQMSYFSLICQLQLSIPQNRLVWLVPCFVGVHHIFTYVYILEDHLLLLSYFPTMVKLMVSTPKSMYEKIKSHMETFRNIHYKTFHTDLSKQSVYTNV